MVMGPKGEPDTKTNWSTDRRQYDKVSSGNPVSGGIVSDETEKYGRELCGSSTQ
jgi:hypothetical protein